MFYYARSDTHYLLYIYDMMRNELAELSAQDSPEGRPIDRVIKKSKEVALQRFENPFCDEETGAGNRGWYNTLLKSPTLYNGEQFAVYKAVHKWRDNVARQDDESTGFVMTQQVLSDIARIMPTDMKALWSLLESNARGLKVRLGELFEVIQKAREKGANGPTMLEFFRQSSTGTLQTADKPVIAAVEEDVEPLNIEELMSDHSQLWGDVALNSRLDGSAKPPPMDEQELIPLYAFDFGAVKEELPEATEPPPKSAPAEAAPPQENEGFTLRAGRKRKADDADMEPASAAEAEAESDVEMDESPEAEQSDAEAGEDTEAAAKARKQARKDRQREKKRVKREAKELIKNGDPNAAQALMDGFRKSQRTIRRAAKSGTTTTPQEDQQTSSAASPSADQPSPSDDQEEEAEEEEDQPFDYAKASSILHATKGANNNGDSGGGGGRGGKGKGKRGGGNKPAFDPYAKKSGDAPAGARKMNYERSGRTATFKK